MVWLLVQPGVREQFVFTEPNESTFSQLTTCRFDSCLFNAPSNKRRYFEQVLFLLVRAWRLLICI